MAKRINGQFDDNDRTYRVEKLVPVFGYVTTWQIERNYVSLKNAELIRRSIEREGGQARIKHESEY